MRVGVYLADQPEEIGGGYTFEAEIVASLVRLAADSRHSFVLFCPQPDALRVQSGRDRIEVVQLPRRTLAERALGQLQQESPTLHRWWKWPNRLDRLVARSSVEFMWFVGPEPVPVDVPYLTVVLDLQHRLQPWFPEVGAIRVWKTREARSWFLRRAAIIIAGTTVGQEEIERFYQIPRQRIALLPHPTPGFALNAPPGDAGEVVAKYGLPENFILYPAQFWSHKNHANLLLAVQILRDEYRLAVPVVFVGSDAGNRAYVEGLVQRLGLSAQVRFLGFVPPAELVALYRRALALVYVTFFGPENLPPLEAFALGCPVVASNAPGAQEQLGDAALLVDPRSPQEIAGAVKSLWDDQGLRETLVQRGLERARKWTGGHFVRGVFALLDEFESVRRCWGR